jgi:hypothetical protein
LRDTLGFVEVFASEDIFFYDVSWRLQTTNGRGIYFFRGYLSIYMAWFLGKTPWDEPALLELTLF